MSKSRASRPLPPADEEEDDTYADHIERIKSLFLKPGAGLKLKILNAFDGQQWEAEVDPNTPIQALHEIAYAQFNPAGVGEDSVIPVFRLIHPIDRRVLGENHAIKDESLNDQDTLLFVEHRKVLSHEIVAESELKPPTMGAILEATKKLAPTPSKNKTTSAATAGTGGLRDGHRNPDSAKDLIMLLHHETLDPTNDFQLELRKMIISLISLMALILEGNSDIDRFCHEMQSKLQKRIKRAVEEKEKLIQTAEDEKMAIKLSEEKAKTKQEATSEKAKLNSKSYKGSSKSKSTNLNAPGAAKRTTNNRATTPSTSKKKEETEEWITVPTPINVPRREIVIKPTPMGIVEGLMQTRIAEFNADPKAVKTLEDMGFNKHDILEALRANKNKCDKAAEWILNTNHMQIDDVITGLDPTSHLLNALTSNPAIRLGLNNPKTLVALFGILDASASGAAWMNDPDVSNVITSIFKVYHTEKHNIDHEQSSSPAASSSSK